MRTNFQGKAVNKDDLVYLVTAQADGKPAWYYLKVDEPKHKAFLKQMETGSLNLAEYGRILYSGWGALPPQAIEALIREQYEAA